MATRAVIRVYDGGWTEVHTASGVVSGDETAAIRCDHTEPEKSVQLSGTLGTGLIVNMQSSNDAVEWDNVTANISVLGMTQFTTSAKFVRLRCTAGIGSSLSMTLLLHPRGVHG